MHSKLSGIKLTLALLLLTPLMTSCGSVPLRLANNCPRLDPPPAAAVNALQKAHDPRVDAWAVKLEKHLEKLDNCA